MMEYFLLAIVGLSVGFMSSILGVGGGVIMVPLFIWIFPSWPYPIIISLSLFVILFNSAQITYFNFKLGQKINLKLVGFLFVGALLGTIIGKQITSSVDEIYLKRFLSLIMLISALRIFKKIHPDSINVHENLEFKFFSMSSLSSIVSLTTGLGGGMVIIPFLQFFTRISINRYVYISNLTMFFISLIAVFLIFLDFEGFIKNFDQSQAPLLIYTILLLSCSTLSAKLGVIVNHKISGNLRQLLFFIILIVFGLRTFIATI